MIVRDLVICMCVCQVVFRQLQYYGDENEELACDFPNIAMEVPDLFPIFSDDLMLSNISPRGDVFVDVKLSLVSRDLPFENK